MKIRRAPHRWQVTPRRAIEIQRDLASRVWFDSPARTPRWIAGCDLAFAGKGFLTNHARICVAAAVLWDLKSRSVVEKRLLTAPVNFPYVPGLLSFREAPAVLAVLRRLKRTPDLIICDGQGLAHPRRFGLACHVGVLTNRPTVGCAKSRLTGRFAALAPHRGSAAPLMDGDERIGTVLRTRTGVKPVYVSVGHRMTLDVACELVLASCEGRRIPEPTRLADQHVAELKRTRGL